MQIKVFICTTVLRMHIKSHTRNTLTLKVTNQTNIKQNHISKDNTLSTQKYDSKACGRHYLQHSLVYRWFSELFFFKHSPFMDTHQPSLVSHSNASVMARSLFNCSKSGPRLQNSHRSQIHIFIGRLYRRFTRRRDANYRSIRQFQTVDCQLRSIHNCYK